ncbi:hypothetical protein pW4_12 [Bacillus phage pW4]|uniref:Lipoprotein n=1 Tax=Bacillus phage pW4 TaxID=2500560 RepID=A0A3Q9R7R7_9CAUD|nr:hypothetical protein PP656_gp009 [Bacillus phage pW4]AZU99034.1 hypothetical protein pW4_12 [Bacillus phage pW4]
MKVRLVAAGMVIATFLTSCSVRDNDDKSSKITNNSKKVEVIQENNQLETKVKDTQNIIKMALQQAYKSDEKLSILETDVVIDKSGRNISLIYNVDAFVDYFKIDRQIGKDYFASQVNLEQWGWIKDKCFEIYGKEANMTAASDITIIIVNKNDGKELKRF